MATLLFFAVYNLRSIEGPWTCICLLLLSSTLLLLSFDFSLVFFRVGFCLFHACCYVVRSEISLLLLFSHLSILPRLTSTCLMQVLMEHHLVQALVYMPPLPVIQLVHQRSLSLNSHHQCFIRQGQHQVPPQQADLIHKALLHHTALLLKDHPSKDLAQGHSQAHSPNHFDQ